MYCNEMILISNAKSSARHFRSEMVWILNGFQNPDKTFRFGIFWMVGIKELDKGRMFDSEKVLFVLFLKYTFLYYLEICW